jgi:hypothetical protein
MVRTLQKSLFITIIVSLALWAHCYAISMIFNEFNRKFITFWCDDVHPMNDMLRIIFYTGMLFIALISPRVRPHVGDSPLQAPELYAYTLPECFTLQGCMQLVGKRWITLKTLQWIRATCLIAWLGCILGFGGIWCPILAAFSMLVLHGIVVGCVGTNHRWYCPVYTMLALTFSNGNGLYSIDHYLSSRYAKYPFRTLNEPSLLNSGFGCKVALASGLLTLLFGGIVKLLNSGVTWMDGKTIAYFVSNDKVGCWPWLKRFTSKSQSFCRMLSIQTVIIELVSPLALFTQLSRSIIIVLATVFHLGIWLTITPNYFPQIWCYSVGLNWYGSEKSQTPVNSTTLTAAWSITGLLIFLTVSCAVLCIDYWPFSSILMYSYYRDESYSHAHLNSIEQIKCVSHQCMSASYNPIGWSHNWIFLRIVDSADNVIDIDDFFVQSGSKHGVTSPQWARVKSVIAARDIMAKVYAQIDLAYRVNSQQYPAQTWLLQNVNVWRSRNWPLPVWTTRDNVKLQLAVRVKNEESIVLASISWLREDSEKQD